MFRSFAALCDQIQGTPKRNDKKGLIAAFLRSLKPDELAPSVTFLTGKPLAETDGRVLELGGSTLWRLAPSRQLTLMDSPLTINDVAKAFNAIADASGSGSRRKKESLVEGLLGRADPAESKCLFRILGGEMRIGAVEGVVMEAISEASDTELASVQRANMLVGSLGEVAEIAMSDGEAGLKGIGARLFRPIKPMLAGMSYDLKEILDEHGGTTALEWKFDGARIQIHKRGEEVKVFSRRLSDVTESLPDIVSLALREIHANEALVEGEAVATGAGGRPLPFQDLMRRFRRVRGVEGMADRIPLSLFLFDLVFLDGRLLIDLPYKERWEELKGIVPSSLMAPRIVTSSIDEGKRFLDSALKAGHEGLVAKALDGVYMPGIRGKKWLKLKPFETLDLAVIAAEWGYGRRTGWLSNYHLAARDEGAGGFAMLGKTFKGLTDEEFKKMTERLQGLKIREDRQTVHVKPGIVVEVAFNELQESPRYESGMALRFARILRIREDKGPDEVDTLERVRGLYRMQFEAKASLNKK